MAQLILKLIIFSASVLLINGSSAFSDILDDSKQCEDKCTKSFAPHTYPNGSENSACMRGCRLYTITNFVKSDEPEHTNDISDDGVTPAKGMCYQSCNEAYNETSTRTAACKSGCDAQELVSLQKSEEKSLEEDLGIHVVTPVMQIREVVSKVFGMLRVVQSTITTYFLRDDNKLVAVEGPVEVVVQMIPPEEVENEIIAEGSVNHQSKEPETLMSRGTASIECISKKVGVPAYLLLVSSVTFSLFLLYILFFVCTSSSREKAKAKTGMPIPTHALPVKLVRPEDLTKLSLMDEDDNQAPPLPHKVKLPDNTKI